MAESTSYVLFDLVSINVKTITNNSGSTIVFCETINVKRHKTQDINSIDDWSNIIIGDPDCEQNYKYTNDDGSATVAVSFIDNNGTIQLENEIGLWSVILFKTITDAYGAYTKLGDVISDSSDIGGSGTIASGVAEVYYNTDEMYYTKNSASVNAFLIDILGKNYNDRIYNGCIFIDNQKCGLLLNISPMMFNNQTTLENISLTNTIVYINESGSAGGVFSNCNKLVNANIPKYLGYYQIITNGDTIDNTARTIPGYYFHNCESLEKITIPDGITQIGFSAFYGCDKVETIDIPSSVLIVYSNSLLTINREKTRYININGDTNKHNITVFGKSIGYTKPLTGDKQPYPNPVIININNRGIVDLWGSTGLNDTSFIDNIGAGSKIYIDCNEIRGVNKGTIVNSATQVYYGGFIGTTFETIYIGPSVQIICNFAFYNVKDTNLIINNGCVLNNEYNDNTANGSLEENKYQDGTGTYLIKTPFVKSNFNSIHILNCGSISNYALHNLYTNELKFFEDNYRYNINFKDNIINSTPLKTIGDYAFYNSNNQFGNIIISGDVTTISNTAFLQTKGSLELKCDISSYNTTLSSDGRTHIGILVNSGFSEINFNYGGRGIIPENILYENKSIKSITLGGGITSISANAFYLCTNLTGTLSLPEYLDSIAETSFIGCRFSEFKSSSAKYQIGSDGMYLLTDNGSSIVLFANKHPNIQITDNTFNIGITTVNKICGYAFAYAFSDYSNSTVYAVNIPGNIKNFGSNVFYNSNKITRIIFFANNIPDFNSSESADNIRVCETSRDIINTNGSFVDLPLLTDVYIGYATGVLLSYSFDDEYTDTEKKWFLHNTLRKSYTNGEPTVKGITIYVHKNLVDDYVSTIWDEAGYTIAIIPDDIPSPAPPVENDDSYDADIDDPEGEEWPWDGGNGNISNEEDYIPPVDNNSSNNEETTDSWITHADNEFQIPIKQLGTPAINVYGCRLDLLNLTDSYSAERISPTPEMIVDQFGNIDFSALDYLKFNKVSNEIHYGSDDDEMLKLYMGDYGNNFLIVFTVTGIDNFDATTKLFTSGVEYATHRESNWLKTEIVRITKKQKIDEVEDNVYYVVLLCTCLKLQNKDNYNCRSAIVSVNYGSQILDSNINNSEQITTKIRVIQHKTELRLSNDIREINITDLPVLFCQQTDRTTFTGNFFIGFPKNFWSIGDTINTDGTSSNKNKLREYINDYFRILYDKEKIKIVGQKTKIGELDYTYIFDVADDKYANIKSEGSTTGTLMTFSSCKNDDKYKDKLNEIHEEYYYVNFKIENLKTSLAGGNWNISIYNIGEPAEMLDIHVVEDQTDIPSIALYPTHAKITGLSYDGSGSFDEHMINDGNDENNIKSCSDIRSNNYVAAECQLPVSITNMPLGKNSTYIFPNIETTDICVNSSAVFTCDDNNMVMSADEITNNFNYALTINIKNNTSGVSSFNMPISSKTLKKQSLSAIKYKKTDLNINPSIYNYDANSNSVVNACLTSTSQITIERIGDKQENDILSNTGAFLYKINTGLSVIADTYTNYLIRTDNTITYMPIITEGESTSLDTIIKASYVSIENNLSIDLLNDGFIIYDEYCNILAPIYPYYNELKYTIIDNGTLLINEYIDSENVYISEDGKTTYYINSNSLATGQTYYCTATNDILIQADVTIDKSIQGYGDNVKARHRQGSAYKVLTKNSTTPTIGVFKDDNNNYKYTAECYGAKSYNGVSKATEVVELIPIYTGLEISNPPDACTYIGDYKLQTYAADYKNHGNIIKVIDTVTVTYSGTKTDLYYKYKDKYYNLDGTEIVIKPTSFNVEDEDYAYFIYLNHNNMNDDGTFTIPGSGGRGYVVGIYDEKPRDPYVIVESRKITETKFYRIYNINVDNALGKYTNVNDVINKNGIYKDFNIPGPNIKYTEVPYKTESFNIADMHVNKYDIACNTNVFRQIFVNFSYNVNDNNTITKVYADNSNGLILQTRMLNIKPNIDPTFNTKITLFGLEIMPSTSDIGFTPIINKPQLYIKP